MNPFDRKKTQENPSENGMYYAKLADKYHVLKFLTLIMLIVFAVFMLFFANDSMRGLHFRYLTKYMEINPMTLDEKYHHISYAVGGGSKFVFYHDDLAVFGEGKLAVYDLAGELKFRDEVAKGILSANASGKYLAVFTPGKPKLSLFHSFGKAWETTFSDPISQVAVSENGMVVVCMKKQNGTSVQVLTDTFEMVSELFLSDGIVMGMAISNDGNALATVSLCGDDGSYYTKFEIWNLKREEIVCSEKLSARTPISVVYLNGDFCFLLDKVLVFYTENGKKTETINLPSASFRYHTDEEGLLLLTSDRVLMRFASDGTVLFSVNVPRSILALKSERKISYLLTENMLMLYNEKGVCISEIPIESGVLDFFVLGDGSILLCYASETKRIKAFETK